MSNKINKFSFRNIAYQEKDGTFTGVNLDLDIVEEGHATIQEAVLSINDATQTHLEAASKVGFPKELVARPAPKEYWQILEKITKPIPSKNTLPDYFQFFTSPLNTSGFRYA